MGILDQAVAWWHADRYDPDVDTQWLDQSGNGHHAQLGSTAGADTNDPTFLPYDGEQYMYLPPSTTLRKVSGTSAAGLSAHTGAEVEYEHDIAADDWASGAYQAPLYGDGIAAMHTLYIRTDGILQIATQGTLGGVSVLSTAAISTVASNGDRVVIKIEHKFSGETKFYYKNLTLGETAFTQLGATVTSTNRGAGYDGADGDTYYVGSTHTGGFPFHGKVFSLKVRDAIGGNLIYHADMSVPTPGAASFLETVNSDTISIYRGSVLEPVVVNRNLWLFAGDDYFEVADHDDLDVAAGESFTVAVVYRKRTDATNESLADKGGLFGLTTGWGLSMGNNEDPRIATRGPSSADTDIGAAVNDSQEHTAAGRGDRATAQLEQFTDGVGTGSPDPSWKTDSIATANPMRIGAGAQATVTYYKYGPIVGVAFFKTALSDADILALDAELRSGPSAGGAPTASIFAPSNLSNWLEAQSISFSGSAADSEEGTLTGSALTWTSSLDAGIGTGSEFSLSSLSLGSHSITLLATDAGGLQDSASVDINVAFNQYPTGTIVSPLERDSYTETAQITFVATASDPEDGSLTGSLLTWSSDVDGALGSGTSIGASLSEGDHTITLTVTDTLGKISSESVSLSVYSLAGAVPERAEIIGNLGSWDEPLEGDQHQGGYNRLEQPQTGPKSRADETEWSPNDSAPISVTLMTIDSIISDHLKKKLTMTVTDGEHRIKVPVEYANAERWKQVRKDGILRDPAGRLQAPIALFRRTSMQRHGLTSPINKYLDRTYQTGWNRYQTYDKFAVMNGIIPSRNLISVRIPDYVDLVYSFMLWTDYVSQMNEVIEQINFESENYWGQRGQFKFYTDIGEYSIEQEVGAVGDRVVKSTFTMNVRAYLLPESYVHTDYGIQGTSQNRYSYKKIITLVEVEQTGENDEESSSKSFPPNE